VDPLADSITNSLAEANRVLAQLRGTMQNLRSLVAPDSPLGNNLDQALQELAAAGQSISEFVDFLKRHPNALIVGSEVLPKKP
jgi:ABC-type transporter Mla subunit MlaD